MIVKELLAQLETATNPVAKALHKNEHFNVLVIGFKKGMLLKEHKASRPSKLTVLQGQVIYREAGREVTASQHDTVEIPVDVVHSVEATQDSLCLLTQG